MIELIELADRQVTVIGEPCDMRKRCRSMAPYISARFGLNIFSGHDLAICSNKRRKLLRVLGLQGNQRVELNCGKEEGTFAKLIARSASRESCWLLTADEVKQCLTSLFGDFERTAPRITLILAPVDMRMHYRSLSLYLSAKFGINVTTGHDVAVCFNRKGRILRIVGLSGNHKLELNSTLEEGSRKRLVKNIQSNQETCYITITELRALLEGQNFVPIQSA